MVRQPARTLPLDHEWSGHNPPVRLTLQGRRPPNAAPRHRAHALVVLAAIAFAAALAPIATADAARAGPPVADAPPTAGGVELLTKTYVQGSARRREALDERRHKAPRERRTRERARRLGGAPARSFAARRSVR